MSVTRRRFIMSGAMTALAAGVALSAGSLAFGQGRRKPSPSQDSTLPFRAQEDPVFYFKRETFQPYVGGVFTIRAGARSIKATLKEVRDCTPQPKTAAHMTKSVQQQRPTDCFALEFQTTGQLTDLTTIYTVEHGALGDFNLFLTRRSPASGTYIYEAVINHAL